LRDGSPSAIAVPRDLPSQHDLKRQAALAKAMRRTNSSG
jgi:hypothetical protein